MSWRDLRLQIKFLSPLQIVILIWETTAVERPHLITWHFTDWWKSPMTCRREEERIYREKNGSTEESEKTRNKTKKSWWKKRNKEVARREKQQNKKEMLRIERNYERKRKEEWKKRNKVLKRKKNGWRKVIEDINGANLSLEYHVWKQPAQASHMTN